MATPMKHIASQQGKTPSQLAAATPPVSTPFSQAQPAFSPLGARSSPQQLKKSPVAATGSLKGDPGSIPPLSFDSPSAAAAMGALGIGSALDIGLDNVAAAVGAAALGLSGPSREADFLKNIDECIDILGKRYGHVSEKGLRGLAEKLGLSSLEEDCEFEGRPCKTIIIGGKALEIQIIIEHNAVHGVTVAFPDSVPLVSKHADKASKILYGDLRLRRGQTTLSKHLDDFATNLGYLATLDRLSTIPLLDCHEAIAGIYESLERLYQWDVAKLKDDPMTPGQTQEQLAMVTRCAKHGCPVMHARDRVGLSLEYWKERWHAPTSTKADVTVSKSERVWSVLIGCAPRSALLYPSIRISDNWISQTIEKSAEDALLPDDIMSSADHPALDWQIPPDTILPPTEEQKNASLDTLQTPLYPDVVFTATMTPPVVLSQSALTQVYGITNAANPMLYAFTSPTYDSILFPVPPGASYDAGDTRMVTTKKSFAYATREGKVLQRTHKTTLVIYKPVYAHTLTELPFSHPREVVAMLPILRQYALLSSILQRTFQEEHREQGAPKDLEDGRRNRSTAANDLVAFKSPMGGGAAPSETRPLDATLTFLPTPRLQVSFPFRSATAEIVVEIGLNGMVHIISQNVLPPEESSGIKAESTGPAENKTASVPVLAHTLQLFEDLSQWAEWIRDRLE